MKLGELCPAPCIPGASAFDIPEPGCSKHGSKGWEAVQKVSDKRGQTVYAALRLGGKIVLNLPHPSKANREFVNLASLPGNAMPTLSQYAETMWQEYRRKPAKPGKKKQSEAEYKRKRQSIWGSIHNLRREIDALGDGGS